MENMLMPREASKFITENATEVKIDVNAIKKCAQLIVKDILNGDHKTNAEYKEKELFPNDLNNEEKIEWTFLVYSSSFSLWMNNSYCVYFNGKMHRGFQAHANSFNRYIAEGKKIFYPKIYAEMTMEELRYIFRSDDRRYDGKYMNKFKMMDEKLQRITENGKILLEKYGGVFMNVIKKANKSALKMMEILVEDFPCYRDVYFYKGKNVALLKKCQMLISDIDYLLGPNYFSDLEVLTVFADYRIPQILSYLGAIKYTPSLMQFIRDNRIFRSGDPSEIEIRGVAIYAVDLILKEARKILNDSGSHSIKLNISTVDFFLWDYRRRNSKAIKRQNITHHRCSSVRY